MKKSELPGWMYPFCWLMVYLQLLVPYQGLIAKGLEEGRNRMGQEKAVERVLQSRPERAGVTWAVKFSSVPTDEELFSCGVTEEPLVPMSVVSTVEERMALGKALTAYSQRQDAGDVGALMGFTKEFPKSTWNPAILLNLGLSYRKQGYFLKAMEAWLKVWDLGKDEQERRIYGLVNRAAAEYVELNSRLGKKEVVEPFLEQIKGRYLTGGTTESIAGAKEGLWMMKTKPGRAYRCGPLALQNVCDYLNIKGVESKIDTLNSEKGGTSLAEVNALSKEMKLNFDVAKRKPGSEMVLPAIIHWKVGHFAALIKKENNRILVKDPTFGEDFWIKQDVIDSEASGYFLVPKGKLPMGWSMAKLEETKELWGRGRCPNVNGKNTRPCDKKTGGSSCSVCDAQGRPKCPCNEMSQGKNARKMAEYSFHALVTSLNIVDTPVWYDPPRGPSIAFTVTYNQREASQGSGVLSRSNLGDKWTFGWLAFIKENSANQVDYFYPGGGSEPYQLDTGNVFLRNVESNAGLSRSGSGNMYYTRTLPDGSIQFFGAASAGPIGSRTVYMTQWTDPQGNSLFYDYSMSYAGRLEAVRNDAGAQATLIYADEVTGGDHYRIIRVEIAVGSAKKIAYFTYSADMSGALTQLASITDAGGIKSEFRYANIAGEVSSFINALITPYGTTTFRAGTSYSSNLPSDTDNTRDFNSRWIMATDPLGQTERLEYVSNVGTWPTEPSPAGISIHNANLNYRNSFYWSKQAMEKNADRCLSVDDCHPRFEDAHVYHWVHAYGPRTDIADALLESEKNPLESRIWYTYRGQDDAWNFPSGDDAQTLPNKIARVLDDGTTQLFQYEYNDVGNVTKYTDPKGRITTFKYDDNQMDLVEVKQVTGVSTTVTLAGIGYDTAHLPLHETNVAGQVTEYGYNTFGQLLHITNALGHILDLDYESASGFLNSVSMPGKGTLASFSPDSFKRVGSVTDAENSTAVYQYDNLDRLLSITYPDSTTKEWKYSLAGTVANNPALLDPVLIKDRQGHYTKLEYDRLGRLLAVRDALGQTSLFDYCSCGRLSSMTDALGRITTWVRDLQGRVQKKIYPDNSTVTYVQEQNTSRLHSQTDALGQITTYTYELDDNLKTVDYSNTQIPTAGLVYNYDTKFNRITSFQDGTGTTTYGYEPIADPPTLNAGRLTSVTAPGSIVTSFSYDELGRRYTQTVDGVSETAGFDALGRIDHVTNPLGVFNYGYVGNTFKLDHMDLGTQRRVDWAYETGTTSNKRLQSIINRTASGIVSQFDYTYDAEGNVRTWTQSVDGGSGKQFAFDYDDLNQLLNATLTSSATKLKEFNYRYDAMGNRSKEHSFIENGDTDLVSTYTSAFGNSNDLEKRSGGTGILVTGTIGTSATVGTVKIDGAPATMTGNGYQGRAFVSQAQNSYTVEAIDTATGRKQKTVFKKDNLTKKTQKTFGYDANGNLLWDLEGTKLNTYEWDAVGNLVAIKHRVDATPGPRTEFKYDGFGRRVRAIEKDASGNTLSDKKFVWSGGRICEQIDALTGIKNFYFGQGFVTNSVNYFYTQDHLGSIREVLNGDGTLKARYDYDPFGKRSPNSVTSSPVEADFGFTGHYYHSPSGLYLTWFRAYDPENGRWLSRDPLGEGAGRNVYLYVGNSPIGYIDPDGLFGIKDPSPGFGGAVVKINGTSYPASNQAMFIGAIGTQPVGSIEKFDYEGHGDPTGGALSLAASKDPSDSNGLISPQRLDEILKRHKDKFKATCIINLKCCGAGNPLVPHNAMDAFKQALPKADITGYTGLEVFGFGVPNNTFFNGYEISRDGWKLHIKLNGPTGGIPDGQKIRY